MKKKRGTGKGRKPAATGARRLAEAAAAEKINSGGQRNSGDPANGGSSGSIARPKAGVGTPTSGFRRSGLNRSSIGDSTSAVRGGFSDSSTPSTRNTLSGSQTSIPTHDGLNPQHGDYELDHHQNQVDLPHEEVYEDSEESDGEEEEGDEQVEEHVVDPAEQQEYDQLLDNLMSLPGRGHLSLLSPHPIPNNDTTWDKKGNIFGLGQLRSKRGKRKRDERCGSLSSSFLDMQQQLQAAQQKLADQDLENARRDAHLDKLLTILKQKDPVVQLLWKKTELPNHPSLISSSVTSFV
ncbi:hypothetical protein AALP_AAs69275U000100 [Arabis alpina]|uniref:Uncharacterized protein n=1 Tax=Arabis alpina TaxID=50452 RepID=A0A087FX51_ARAAL|nr:hypothetical protein AALP_AAs69275U000100 [Arabis alpina]